MMSFSKRGGEGGMKLKLWLKTQPINQNLIVFYYVVRKIGGSKIILKLSFGFGRICEEYVEVFRKFYAI